MNRASATVLSFLLILGGAGCQWSGGLVFGVDRVEAITLVAQRAAAGAPLVIDARDAESHRNGHVLGAISLGMDDLMKVLILNRGGQGWETGNCVSKPTRSPGMGRHCRRNVYREVTKCVN